MGESNILPFIQNDQNDHNDQNDLENSYEKKLARISACSLGDKIILFPVQGKRREFIVNRTRICFRSIMPTDVDSLDTVVIILPTIHRYLLNFELKIEMNENKVVMGCRLSSLNEIPFRLNGNFCFDSYIERNDKVVLGYNTLLFLKSDESIRNRNNINSIDPILNNKRLMESDINILIEGETGSGKTYLAKEIHERSGRRGAFVHININSFASGLIESELFGHIRGAYTGAHNDKKGAFLEASNGTLFIDEIDSLPIEIQIKLLLFLDFKKIRPVGSSREIKCEVRLIFASGKNLSELVVESKMRSDFYYRILSGVKLEVIPLRDDKNKLHNVLDWLSQIEDIVFTKELRAFYASLYWPGNLRELIAHIKKKKIFTKGRKLHYDQLDQELLNNKLNLQHLRASSEGKSKKLSKSFEIDDQFYTLEEIKIRAILKAYYHFDCNLNYTAKVMNVSTNTIRKIIGQ
ncbi:MAG: sigma 54-interacting transcriptional regulator [Oligoflexia bacterium]|nr:sigma 54-interacting transcriptional regulator [Oligoflexia bacterium]